MTRTFEDDVMAGMFERVDCKMGGKPASRGHGLYTYELRFVGDPC